MKFAYTKLLLLISIILISSVISEEENKLKKRAKVQVQKKMLYKVRKTEVVKKNSEFLKSYASASNTTNATASPLTAEDLKLSPEMTKKVLE